MGQGSKNNRLIGGEYFFHCWTSDGQMIVYCDL